MKLKIDKSFYVLIPLVSLKVHCGLVSRSFPFLETTLLNNFANIFIPTLFQHYSVPELVKIDANLSALKSYGLNLKYCINNGTFVKAFIGLIT